ncbi:MAG TPA: hypothetical protein VNG13_04255 [Mycobacteriales bacterium]|nr:hypothetical protein [Mycobacteriales bacterium]
MAVEAAWDVVFYQVADGAVPGDEFLRKCPVKVRARLMAVLDAVAEAPPPQFDFTTGRLSIRNSIVEVEACDDGVGWMWATPKTERSRRVIVLDTATLALLRAHRTR